MGNGEKRRGKMAKGIKRLLKRVRQNVEKEIKMNCGNGSSLYARGLASEGYAGGYRDALLDVGLALNGIPPCCRPEFWR